MIGEPDEAILALATVEGRIVFTHDGDFGSLAIAKGLPYIGIVYLRPGHVGATLTIDSIEKLLSVDPDMHPPFIVVVKRTNAGATIRLRQTAP